MANKILITLQSLVSCFLEYFEQVSCGRCNWGSLAGVTPICPEGSTICCILVAVAQAGEYSFVLNLLCAKDQASENWSAQVTALVSIGQAFSRFSSRLWRGFLSTFFPLLFPPILQLLSPSMTLLTKYLAGHHLRISESCGWICLPKIGTQTHVAEILCYA